MARSWAALVLAAVVGVAVLGGCASPTHPPSGAHDAAAAKAAAGPWKNSCIGNPDFFPLIVWCQRSDKAAQYKAIGMNTYMAIWEGPQEADLVALKQAGMKLICDQNAVGLKHLDDPTIIGWMHEDEPDNTRNFEKVWKSDLAAIKKAWPGLSAEDYDAATKWGIPTSPSMIVALYEKMKKNDPTRPVQLGLGQGVAYEAYKGRGARTGHLEDYPAYLKGCDIVDYDIYPVNHDKPEIKGRLWVVARGVDRLVQWADGRKIVWNDIECTRIDGEKPTPAQTRTEIWMSIIHGSHGIVYFCHQFQPTRSSSALLEDREMCAVVARTNKQITELAAVINSPTLTDAVTVESSNPDVPVDVLAKEKDGVVYLFAVAMRDGATRAKFKIARSVGKTGEVLGESRKIDINGNRFTDDFKPYEVHLYKIPRMYSFLFTPAK